MKETTLEQLIKINVLRDVEIAMYEMSLPDGSMQKMTEALRFLENNYLK